jgi:cobalt-precorrin 5A hydrolase / precorrin-3B C17-methyltransferase
MVDNPHPGTVYFIGAGPGAPDLITVRGQRIIEQADLILYADSLVQESVATLARKRGVKVVRSSGMHLDQIVNTMVEAARAGGVVARVHTGDPMLYGAIQEQIAGLDAAGISCEIVPGVTAAFAAAARLGTAFTLPGVTQTLILSRIAGRTPVPETEDLSALAAHGASLVLYLSLDQIEHVVATLLANSGYTQQTPVAVVHKVTWPDEHILVGTLADIAGQVRAAGYTRHALIIISPAISCTTPHLSKLYDRTFTHSFRTSEYTLDARNDKDKDKGEEEDRGEEEEIQRDTIIIAVTRAGAQLASRLARVLQADMIIPARFADEPNAKPYYGSVLDEVGQCWSHYQYLVLVMASGIAVRSIAPLLGSKNSDPAVVCMDETGQSVIPLIGGHRAGANNLARRIAAITKGHAAITTASDVQGKPALDMPGGPVQWKIDPTSAQTHTSACMVNGDIVGVYIEPELAAVRQQTQIWVAQAKNLLVVQHPDDLAVEAIAAGLIITHRQPGKYNHLLHKSMIIYPPSLVVGMGCHEGTGENELQTALETTLAEAGFALESVTAIATISLKAKEAGLHQMAEHLGLPLRFITEEQVQAVDNSQISNTSAAREHLGLPGVAEPCALIASGGGVLLGPRRKFPRCTVALALIDKLKQEVCIGRLVLVSIGPGDPAQMTIAAREALQSADVVVGYHPYIDLVRPLLFPGQEIIAGTMRQEMQRAEQALDLAAAGRCVALISSGDVGIYGMAGPVFEALRQREWKGNNPTIETCPGVSAFQAAAARVGAPINHDICIISLSDLLTDWAVIERRLWAAARGDFVVAIYNPQSRKRNWQLACARDILLEERPSTTPVALVRNATRADEMVMLTTLAALDVTLADMVTVVIVGSSKSYTIAGKMATPRGYYRLNTPVFDANVQHPIPDTHLPDPHPFSVYPITLTHVQSTLALVIGGGRVGERKIRGLLDAGGGRVRLISPDATPQICEWAKMGRIEWAQHCYSSGDLEYGEKLSLVFAATNQREINRQIALAAEKLGLLCNVADAPHEGTFHVPAMHRGQGLVVAVGTMGTSPNRATQVRDWIRDRIAEIVAEMENDER